jgi:magnesium-transporting ATPase (P-type)
MAPRRLRGRADQLGRLAHAPSAPVLCVAQVLTVNMVTSVTLGLVLALEKAEPDIMTRKPRDPKKPILDGLTLWRTFIVTTTLVVLILGNQEWTFVVDGGSRSDPLLLAKVRGQGLPLQRSLVHPGRPSSPRSLPHPPRSSPSPHSQGRAVAMTTLVTAQAFYAINCRYIWNPSLHPLAWIENHWMFAMVLINIGFQCFLVYVPKVQDVWEMTDIDANAWGRIILLSSCLFLAVEFEKWFAPRYVFPIFEPYMARKTATVHDRMSAGAGHSAAAAAAAAASKEESKESKEEKAVAA